ncbi:MAG: AI-2E family transporter [Rubrobacteraceae bacterium]
MAKTRSKTPRSRADEPWGGPTPIWISPRTRTILLLSGLVVLVVLMWAAPSVPLIALGGGTLALIMSFPVRALSRFMPRGLGILASFLALVGLIILAFAILVPIIIDQLTNLILNIPSFAEEANQQLSNLMPTLLSQLGERGLLPGDPEELLPELGADLGNEAFSRVQDLAQNVLGGLLGFISSAFNFGIALFGVVFIAVYLLVDVRRMKAAYLLTVPHGYRRDSSDLWNAFGVSLSRYLSGLGFVLVIQGVVSAIALALLGIQYAILLGVWVSITAIIPYIGAWLGAVPAVALALLLGSNTLPINPLTAGLLTLLVFVAIQQLEGNFLTPRIQGEAVHVHPILVFLAVIAGGEIAGLLGVIFAVPALAVLRVLFDFFRVRLRLKNPGAEPQSPND